VEKIVRIKDKFLSADEVTAWGIGNRQLAMADSQLLTLLWSCKEAVFKWYGNGGVDFSEHIQLQKQNSESSNIDCFFSKNQTELSVNYHLFDHLVLAWVMS
jgi:phosphopantetheinyl transferase